MNGPEAKRGKRPLLWLLLITALPLALAGALYYSGWRPGGSVSHGELIQPPRPLGARELRRADGTPLAATALQGKWSLIFLLPGRCEEVCVRALYAMRGAHLAQGREQGRVRRVVVGAPPQLAELARSDPGLDALAGTIGGLDAEAPGRWIYLADPLGNLVLRFDPAADPAGLRKDLGHLLKHSWIG